MSKIREILDNLSNEQYEMMIGKKSIQPLTDTFSKKRVVHPGANGQVIPPLKQQEIWFEYMQKKEIKIKRKQYIYTFLFVVNYVYIVVFSKIILMKNANLCM